jgi:hypothetical protein
LTAQPPDDGGALPRAVYSGTVILAGFEITTHMLDNGQRVLEDTPELRGLFAWIAEGNVLDVEAVSTALAARRPAPEKGERT